MFMYNIVYEMYRLPNRYIVNTIANQSARVL